MIEKKLDQLKTTKFAGPDGFHSQILSELTHFIKLPLSIIFKKSCQESCLPNTQETRITPIHKKEEMVLTGNYRQVRLTSVIGKMMESIAEDQLVKHMTDQFVMLSRDLSPDDHS